MSNSRKDNQRLKQQLAIAQDELRTIKSSKAFKGIRIAGHLRNEFKQSPVKFIKKAATKLTNGTLVSKGTALHDNISSKDTLQSQYSNWIVLNEPDTTELDNQKIIADSFSKKPLISIVTPVYNPPIDIFEELIESVLGQTYPNFELCLYDDYGGNQEIIELIEKYVKKDSRVRFLPFEGNKGIGGASNRILEAAKGEYIALLDHDDTLSTNALFENVKLLNEDDYDFIYSDKDKIDEQGNRFEPFFKPGWSPEIMLNANYLTHLDVMKTSIVRKVGGWDSTTDGAQDWDLFLKVVASSKKVGHIQKILYHWRVIATSTSMSIETKPYALEGQRRAVDAYLKKEKIPAKSYHVGAELLLEWKPTKSKTVCVVISHSNTHLRTFLNGLPTGATSDKDLQFVVMYTYEQDKTINVKGVNYVKYGKGEYLDALSTVISKYAKDYVLFFDDRLNFTLSKEDIRNLSGWVDIDNVFASSPRIVNAKGYAIDSGAVITNKGVQPLFTNSPPYYQAAIGNIEWIRDMALVSPFIFVSRVANVSTALSRLKKLTIKDELVHSAIQLEFTKKGRLVFNPKVLVRLAEHTHIDVVERYESVDELLPKISVADPYINHNMSSEDPMRLADIVHAEEIDELPEIEHGYQVEASAHANARTITIDLIQKNEEVLRTENAKSLKSIDSVVIFVPDFQAIYAGLNNIFTYADTLRRKNAKVTFALMSADKSFDRQRSLITEKFPDLGQEATIIAVSNESVATLPHFDVAICTQWATAYILALFNKTHRKCYFIQDKEASFYPKGTISALVENTYKFGFFALANTPGLLSWYKKEYSGDGVVVKSIVNLSEYSPEKTHNTSPKAPYKVFFYARPNEPRNAFELATASLVKLKRKMGDNVQIFAAGADWDTESYGLDDVLTNLGKINYQKLPNFYRSMDAGIMFMLSGHPGVVASELMASGCPVIVNEYDDATWHDLYQDGKTCLVSIPTADEVARNVQRSLEDVALREVIIVGGLAKVKEFYAGYDKSVEVAHSTLLKPIR